MEKNLTHFSSTNFSHHLTSEQHRGYKRIFFTSIRPQHSLLLSPPNCGVDSNTVESSFDEIYVNTRKKRRTHWRRGVREREKNNCLLQSTNKKEKREKNCCLLIVTEVFMLPLFFSFFFFAVYLSIKQNSNERINTWRSPFAFTINRGLLFVFLFSLNSHSYILLPSAMCTLRTLHALYIVVERWREGGGCGSSGWKEVRKIYSIETTYTFMRNIMKSRAIFFFYTMFIYENIFYKKTCVWESVYGSFSYYFFFHYQLCVIHDLFFFFQIWVGVKKNWIYCRSLTE